MQVAGGLCLAVLVGVQLMLGAGSWVVKYGMPRWATSMLGETKLVNREADSLQNAIVTSHVAVGSLILVTRWQSVCGWPGSLALAHPLERETDAVSGGGPMSTTSVLNTERRQSAVLTRLADYLELTKPRIVVLELIVAGAAACLAMPHGLNAPW